MIAIAVNVFLSMVSPLALPTVRLIHALYAPFRSRRIGRFPELVGNFFRHRRGGLLDWWLAGIRDYGR